MLGGRWRERAMQKDKESGRTACDAQGHPWQNRLGVAVIRRGPSAQDLFRLWRWLWLRYTGCVVRSSAHVADGGRLGRVNHDFLVRWKSQNMLARRPSLIDAG